MAYILVLCTINDFDKAKSISRELLEKKLIACSNIIPQITSIYTWEDKLVEDTEYLMFLKTKQQLFPEVKEAIMQLHPYDVPEIISVKLDAGSEEYFKWINESVTL